MLSGLRLRRQTVYIILLAVLLAGGVAAMHVFPGHGTGQTSVMTTSGAGHPGDGDGEATASPGLAAICLGVVGSVLLLFGPRLGRGIRKGPRLRRRFQVYLSPVVSATGKTGLYLRLRALRR